MNKYAEELIASILEEHAQCAKDNVELEAKSLFRLLNYCPPERSKSRHLAIELLKRIPRI